MSSNESELPKDAKGWADYVRNINYADHKKALLGLGIAAAFGIGAGAVVHAKHKKLKVDFADRWYEQKEVISVYERGEDGKIAAGLPKSEEAFEKVSGGPEFFIMDEAGTARLNSDLEMDAQKEGTLRKIGGWFAEHFTSQAEGQ